MRRSSDQGRDTDDLARARLGLAPARRPRRRTLSRRGRATLAVGIASVGLLAVLALPVGVPLPRPVSERSSGDIEQDEPLPAVPEELLSRLPNSRKVLQLERTGHSQFAVGESVAGQQHVPVDPGSAPRFVEWVDAPAGFAGPLRIEYALDAELGERVFALLRRARVKRGHVVVLDVRSGRVMAYASVDPKALPPRAAYPAASLAKVVTAAASLERDRQRAVQPCRYRGDPYRLNKKRVHPARGGHQATLERALARSYNQCFAQLAVHALGDSEMRRAFARFRWLASPAPGHSRGVIDRGEGDYGLGRLGAGLAGSRITALYAAQLAGSLGSGELVDPWWIDRVVDTRGRELSLPPRGGRHRVMEQETADEVRRMLVRTTTNGTARSAFRTSRGPRLGDVRVAGKTGNLTGSAPHARYEWFAGTAPAEDPRVAVAVVQAHGHLWWKMSAEIAADVFAELFCEKRRCSAEHVARYTGDLGLEAAPLLLGEANDAPSG